jgi:hypothetical protein
MKVASVTVAAFAELMKHGECFPPVFVVRSRRDDSFTVINGRCRVAASITCGYSFIPCRW